jgi:hypothetical protein
MLIVFSALDSTAPAQNKPGAPLAPGGYSLLKELTTARPVALALR